MENEKIITISLPRLNFWMILSIVLVVVLVLSFAGILPFGMTGGMVTTNEMSGLTADEAANKAVKYINDNLIQSGSASMISVEDFYGIYKVTTSYQGQRIPVYITKDGRYLFVSQPIDTSVTPTTQPQQAQEAPKSDRPDVHAFVMSYCPYGLQFLKAYIPVIELLGDKADLEVNFVTYAMHGEKEVYENLRMYCIQKEQKDKFTNYLRCFVKEGDYEGCMDEVGVDKDKLQTCMDETDKEFKITEKLNDRESWVGNFPPFDIDTELSTKYGVRGSPTFVINGQQITVDRSPEAIKETICQAFNNPPEECKQQLSTTVEQPGLGEIGSGSSSASSSGGCA